MAHIASQHGPSPLSLGAKGLNDRPKVTWKVSTEPGRALILHHNLLFEAPYIRVLPQKTEIIG